MQLHTLMKLIKNHFVVDEELRVYRYADRLEFYDYISPVYNDNNEKLMEEMEGRLLILYYNDNNVVTAVEHSCLKLVNERNKNLYKFVINLVGTEITDLYEYKMLEDKED